MSEFVLNPARHGPFPGRLAPETIAAYAAATGDHTAAVLDGRAVPAVFPVILVFTPEEAARADVPEASGSTSAAGCTGNTTSWCTDRSSPVSVWIPGRQLSAVRTTRAGTQIVVQFEQVDADGAVAVEQWWTMVLLGLQGVADLGTMPGDHRFPDDARAHPLGSVTQHIDKDVAHRYAEVSGDWSAHHFDIEVARAAGFDFVFTHGLCTMAICTHRLLGLLGVDDPARVRRVAVRFASPTPLGLRADGECLWHRREFVRLRGRRQRHDHHHPRKIGTAAMSKPEIGVYLPQMGFTYDQILHRTLRCEQLGIDSLWLYDHLYGPGRPTIPSMEAWTLATALLSRTERIRDRTHGAVQPVPSPRGPGEDGHDAGPDLGGPASTRHRQRFHRRRAHPGRAGLGNVRRAVRTARARRCRSCIRRSPTR